MSTTTAVRRGPFDATESTVVIVRVGLLLLIAVIALLRLSGGRPVPATSLAVLVVVATLASIPVPWQRLRMVRPLLEAVAASVVIGLAEPFDDTLLPYLVVPPLAAGLLGGVVPALTASALELASILGVRFVVVGDAADPAVLSSIAQWVGLGVATGLVGAWARRVAVRERAASSTYMTAHGLLTRLRDVARALPTGLDEVALAQQVLAQMQAQVPFDRGALYGSAGGGVLMPLAYVGADHLDWMPDIDEGMWGRVWDSGLPAQQTGRFTGDGAQDDGGYSAVLALTLGARRVGLVALERDDSAWTRREIERAQQLVDDAALRIDTGQLFSEVRALATVEERRRLAREIHDGVAQEVAALGFVVDDIAAREKDPQVLPDLMRLREELTRIVSELRLSIFDLRSDVQPSTGLGAALSSYVRSVGTGSGLTVHLVLDESSYRLPIEAESELLRVAQEAITNARKHARARNLWVTCRVDPPRAFLRIADDGRGLGAPRDDSFGLEIMRERAARLGATLTVRQRVGGGTVVEVTLGAGGGARPSDAAASAS